VNGTGLNSPNRGLSVKNEIVSERKNNVQFQVNSHCTNNLALNSKQFVEKPLIE
jgi:hypothetical protein